MIHLVAFINEQGCLKMLSPWTADCVLEEENSYVKRAGKKKGDNGVGHLPLHYTVLKKILILFRSPVPTLIFA